MRKEKEIVCITVYIPAAACPVSKKYVIPIRFDFKCSRHGFLLPLVGGGKSAWLFGLKDGADNDLETNNQQKRQQYNKQVILNPVP